MLEVWTVVHPLCKAAQVRSQRLSRRGGDTAPEAHSDKHAEHEHECHLRVKGRGGSRVLALANDYHGTRSLICPGYSEVDMTGFASIA